MKIAATVAAVLATIAASAAPAQPLQIPGATSASYLLAAQHDRIQAASGVDLVIDDVGAGHAVLDVIEGRAKVAVVTESLMDAVADARIAKWTDERRLLLVSPALAYYPVAASTTGARPLGFVTMSAPSPELARLIEYLNSEAGLRALAR